MTTDLYKQKLELVEKLKKLEVGLPHIYGHKFYSWQREFWESKNHMLICSAANQVGKSTANIIRNIRFATEQDKWQSRWSIPPNLFWYLYPSQPVINTEFETKWKKYLPSGEYKKDKIYGWEEITNSGDTVGIQFNSGVLLQFKMYSQKTMNIQSSTVFMISTDEELPEMHLSELLSRLNAVDGYFSMVYTATLGQEIWRKTMEETGEMELYKDAHKLHVTLFDCMKYEDGTPGMYSERRIKQIINSYPTEAEVQRRVYGRHVVDVGRVYESFDPKQNVVHPYNIGNDWYIYVGIDIGSGGTNHPSAIAMIAVRPDFKKGAVFSCWNSGKAVVTPKDVLDKYRLMTAGLRITATFYDWSAKDFESVCIQEQVPMIKAEKSHELGEGILNVLFKNKKLDIFNTLENSSLVNELCSLKTDTLKTKATDDSIDAVRYGCVKVPWDYSDISDTVIVGETVSTDVEERRRLFNKPQEDYIASVDQEVDEINDMMEN